MTTSFRNWKSAYGGLVHLKRRGYVATLCGRAGDSPGSLVEGRVVTCKACLKAKEEIDMPPELKTHAPDVPKGPMKLADAAELAEAWMRFSGDSTTVKTGVKSSKVTVNAHALYAFMARLQSAETAMKDLVEGKDSVKAMNAIYCHLERVGK